jgi:hypothetical protein
MLEPRTTRTYTLRFSSLTFSASAFFAAFSMFSFLPNGKRIAQVSIKVVEREDVDWTQTHSLGSLGLSIRLTSPNFLVLAALPCGSKDVG